MKRINMTEITEKHPIIGFGIDSISFYMILAMDVDDNDGKAGFSTLWIDGGVIPEVDWDMKCWETWQTLVCETLAWYCPAVRDSAPPKAYYFKDMRDLYRHLGIGVSLRKCAMEISINL